MYFLLGVSMSSVASSSPIDCMGDLSSNCVEWDVSSVHINIHTFACMLMSWFAFARPK